MPALFSEDYVASGFQSNVFLETQNSLGLGNLLLLWTTIFLLADKENVIICHNVDLMIKLTLRYSCNISIYFRTELRWNPPWINLATGLGYEPCGKCVTGSVSVGVLSAPWTQAACVSWMSPALLSEISSRLHLQAQKVWVHCSHLQFTYFFSTWSELATLSHLPLVTFCGCENCFSLYPTLATVVMYHLTYPSLWVTSALHIVRAPIVNQVLVS